MRRESGRKRDQLRPVEILPGYVIHPEGNVLISTGLTRVICSATIEEKVPEWKTSGGWVTAEYALLPRSTRVRSPREVDGFGGRTQEIRRLIGRSLRAAVDLRYLDGLTCRLDCDVLQADGGTRTAAVTGSYLALAIALQKRIQQGILDPRALLSPIAAVSVGMVEGVSLLDLDYGEDSRADVDFNVVMNARGEYIEVQGTAEKGLFKRRDLNDMLDLAEKGIRELLTYQQNGFQQLQE